MTDPVFLSRWQEGYASTPDGDYTEYRDGKGKVVGRMLYDHQSDPLENENIVDAEGQEERVKSLAIQLKKARNSTRKN